MIRDHKNGTINIPSCPLMEGSAEDELVCGAENADGVFNDGGAAKRSTLNRSEFASKKNS